MISSRSIWAQSSLFTKIVVAVVVIAGSALLGWIEYLDGNRSGPFNSLAWACIPSITLAASILFLSVGRVLMRQEQVAWYKQMTFFRGIGCACMAVGMLLLSFLLTAGSSGSHIAPPPTLLIVLLDSVCLFQAFFCIVQAIIPNYSPPKSLP